MGQVLLIFQKDFFTRLRSKSFFYTLLLGPLAIVAIMIVPQWMAVGFKTERTILLNVEVANLNLDYEDKEKLLFEPITVSPEEARELVINEKKDALLSIVPTSDSTFKSTLYSKSGLGTFVLRDVERMIENAVVGQKLNQVGLSTGYINEVKRSVDIETVTLSEVAGEDDKEVNSGVATIAGIALAFPVFFFLLFFGNAVMASVIEEKANRVVEIVSMAVKPFNLMMGKILATVCLALVQLIGWVAVTAAYAWIAVGLFGVNLGKDQAQVNAPGGMDAEQMKEVSGLMASLGIDKIIEGLPIGTMIFGFLFFFIFGYLLYAAFFAAIGSAVDSMQDAGRLTFPIMLPLIVASSSMNLIFNEPNGPVAFWMSIIPLTSPMMMPLRIPMDVPLWELLLSMGLLIITSLLAIYISGRIFRAGLLMYGAKPKFSTLFKWLKQSN